MPIEDEFNPSADNPFIGRQDQPSQLTDEPAFETPATQSEQPKKTLRDHWDDLSTSEKVKFAGVTTATASLAALALIGGPELVDQANGPDFGSETTTITVNQGDDLWKIAESIPGHEHAGTDDIIAHIKADPANIDILQSSTLQPGMTITIPIEIGK